MNPFCRRDATIEAHSALLNVDSAQIASPSRYVNVLPGFALRAFDYPSLKNSRNGEEMGC